MESIGGLIHIHAACAPASNKHFGIDGAWIHGDECDPRISHLFQSKASKHHDHEHLAEAIGVMRAPTALLKLQVIVVELVQLSVAVSMGNGWSNDHTLRLVLHFCQNGVCHVEWAQDVDYESPFILSIFTFVWSVFIEDTGVVNKTIKLPQWLVILWIEVFKNCLSELLDLLKRGEIVAEWLESKVLILPRFFFDEFYSWLNSLRISPMNRNNSRRACLRRSLG